MLWRLIDGVSLIRGCPRARCRLESEDDGRLEVAAASRFWSSDGQAKRKRGAR